MSATKSVYKVIRSVLLTAVIVVVALLVATYVALSFPSVQSKLKTVAESELSNLLKSKVTITELQIFPFNEVRLYGVNLYNTKGQRCISVGRIGAGIELWTLLIKGEINVSYAEIIAMNANINQPAADAPLNIQFLIDAFKPKQKKEKKKFNLALHNVVIRKSNIAFNRTYIPRRNNDKILDFNHLEIFNLNADVSLPELSDSKIVVDLRRLAFIERSGFNLQSLSVKADISEKELAFSNLKIKVGSSEFKISDQKLSIDGYADIVHALMHENHCLVLSGSPVYPADFAAFAPALTDLNLKFALNVQLNGTPDNLDISNFEIDEANNNLFFSFDGTLNNLTIPSTLNGSLNNLTLKTSAEFINYVDSHFTKLDSKVANAIAALGQVNLSAHGNFDLVTSKSNPELIIASDAGTLHAAAELSWVQSSISAQNAVIKSESLNIGKILNNEKLDEIALEVEGEVNVSDNDIQGLITAEIPFVDYQGNRISNIEINARKRGNQLDGNVAVNDRLANLNINFDSNIDKDKTELRLKSDIERIMFSILKGKYYNSNDYLQAAIEADLKGSNIDNLTGNVRISDFKLSAKDPLLIKQINVTSEREDEYRSYTLDSDFATMRIDGNFNTSVIAGMIQNLVAQNLPALVNGTIATDTNGQYADLHLTLMPSNELYQILHTPVKPGVDVNVDVHIDGSERLATLKVDAPYLIQGKNKLIKSTRIEIIAQQDKPLIANIKTNFPLKNDRANFDVNLTALTNHVDLDMGWIMDGNHDNVGNVKLGADFSRKPINNQLAINAILGDSRFKINGADWSVSPAVIYYSNKTLTSSTIRIAHDMQFITIGGRASQNPLDVLEVELAGIDLEYLFNILNINHVNFGGYATGSAHVSNLFNGTPIAQTDGMFVKNLAYNGCVLGDGQLESHWDNKEGLVAINADITGTDDASARVRGGVYVTRDSLSFDFNANKINIGFLKPFVSGFTSEIRGKATGYAKLYGTFSDIDLTGKVFADTLTMRVDYTNVEYSTSDTVYFTPGLIRIPELRLYDKYGNSGLFSGEVTHKFLKNPSFNFKLWKAHGLLGYDVPTRPGERWSGHIFVNGNASLTGRPGRIALDMNLSTSVGSEFTFVLDETQNADEYTFLTFSDRRKEEEEKLIVKEESFEEIFEKNNNESETQHPDVFSMNMGIDVTPAANLVIVMDPTAGDKIKAVGSGALQMHYATDSDEMTLYGKYTLDRGEYNFSLQDLILKNFKIEKGSSISFNGDPENGILDIVAAYRVNTNLTDLDQSFKNDADLNRTSVPVDALLKVTGDIHSPDLNFDLRLPTMNAEAERKMRSIVSTEDMLNRQVIYLLALNRFYTPEYSGGDQGSELASVASSTLSSQIQNMIGSMTDKFSLSPTFKSERSDLSDMEFDVALSSSLFDNRLLINGNLGYRDKSTSQTTFIGDFDIEYLLTRDGKLRLKAYNHFNDASYYLKSSLTTQGIGIIYRKDFDDPFTFLKKKKNKKLPKVVKTGDRRQETGDRRQQTADRNHK